ncbi:MULTISPECIES: M91 family zinc metallopeptidase [Pseudomonas]|uniref:Hemolysin n=1 Tax=Pseudomonas gessardii TaxID=78544 RepID=A0A7Y1MSR6_9PSED|nr:MULTISPECIES: M91 family zinc metallopeptidase [Pseudomonas]NNA97674.1 hemolysin [Pseudomonas gessardii]
MVIATSLQPLNLPPPSQPAVALAGNSVSNPITIQSPPLKKSHAQFTSSSKLTPDQNYVEKYPVYTNSFTLFSDNHIKITHKVTWEKTKDDGYINRNNALQIVTGDNSDLIKVNPSSGNDIHLEVNGTHYLLKINNHEDYPEQLHIKSKGGDDHIRVDPRVTIPITIEGGRGNDRIETLGSGATRVYGGAGDDDITLGSGDSYAEGNSGNDKMRGGTGKTVMYGNNGADLMFSGPGSKGTFSYMDGGTGNDTMIGASPLNLMHGGPGEDLMYSIGPTTFYTGRGRDTVLANHTSDRIYADAGDRVARVAGSTLRQVRINDAGHKAFKIEGSDKFKQQTQDDLEFFRNSPTAQTMLTELDQAAELNGSPVTIRETGDRPNYSFRNNLTREYDKQLKEYDDLAESPLLGFIQGQAKGSVATGAAINNNPGLIVEEPPVISLYHEMAHAYNGAHGTLLPGQTNDEPNLERQAVGLETNAPAFDFDNNPRTPPTTTNPKPFTENALREETGFPRRNSYIQPAEE